MYIKFLHKCFAEISLWASPDKATKIHTYYPFWVVRATTVFSKGQEGCVLFSVYSKFIVVYIITQFVVGSRHQSTIVKRKF